MYIGEKDSPTRKALVFKKKVFCIKLPYDAV